MNLERLLEELEPVRVEGQSNREITDIAYDSRRVSPGALFVALQGRRVDGSTFIREAEERGAAAVLCERSVSVKSGVCLVVAPDARLAMAQAACAFYGHPSRKLKVAGITGTNGKTTVSFMTRHAFESAGIKTGLVGTVQYMIGDRAIPASRTTPEAPDLQRMLGQMAQIGCEAAVMEVSSHSLVQKRTRGVEYYACVFTNLTQDHMDFHGTFEEYFRAKSLLFAPDSGAPAPRFAIINVDDPWGVKLLETCAGGTEIVAFGEDEKASVRAENIVLNDCGSAAHVRSPWGEADIRLGLIGAFNVSNALAALAVCGAAGLDFEEAADSLASLKGVPGRLEQVDGSAGFKVFVDYAHTPDALQNVLSALRAITRNRLIAVFGCGGNRDARKRPLMGAAAACLADKVFVTSDNPRRENPDDIIAQILMGIENKDKVSVVGDRRQAIRAAIAEAREGDVVVIAGKGHENYQEFYNTVVPFDDRQEAAACLK